MSNLKKLKKTQLGKRRFEVKMTYKIKDLKL